MFRFANTPFIARDEKKFVGFLGNRAGIPVSKQPARCGPPPQSCFSVESPPFSVFNHMALSGKRSESGRGDLPPSAGSPRPSSLHPMESGSFITVPWKCLCLVTGALRRCCPLLRPLRWRLLLKMQI